MKKMIAIVLALMLCVSALSVVAFAAPEGIDSLAVVGSGMPGVDEWQPGSATGDMTEVSNNVYETVISGVTAGTQIALKVAGNDAWVDTCNFGSGTIVFGEWAEMECGGGSSDMKFTVDQDCDLKVTVDLNDFAAGGKAKIKVEKINVSGEVVETPEEPAAPATYYVAGTAALCNDKEWDAGAAENVMTKGDDGIWTITYTGVAAGEYELKVTDGTWTNSWGKDGENVKFTLTEATDVIVKFNPATSKVTVLVNGEDMNPGTGDMSLAAVSVALLAATAGLVAVVSKKKEF